MHFPFTTEEYKKKGKRIGVYSVQWGCFSLHWHLSLEVGGGVDPVFSLSLFINVKLCLFPIILVSELCPPLRHSCHDVHFKGMGGDDF